MTMLPGEDGAGPIAFNTNLVQAPKEKEATAAMILVLRLFLKSTDGIELHQIENLYQELPVSGEEKHWVSENLKALDTFLDRETELALNGTRLTYRGVLETILYGDQADVNDDRRAIFEAWREYHPIRLVLENFFEFAAVETIRYIQWLAAMNVHTIHVIETAGKAS